MTPVMAGSFPTDIVAMIEKSIRSNFIEIEGSMNKQLRFAVVALALAATSVQAADRVRSNETNTEFRNPTMSTDDKVDNSARNARDRDLKKLTADDQANDDNSLRITQIIRKGILNRSDFSMYAKNVKIIADGSGLVTLRGPVRTLAEKEEIGRIASSASGTSKVNNELEIAPNS